MMKAALLYGDAVTLCDTSAMLLAGLHRVIRMKGEERLALVDSLSEQFSGGGDVASFREGIRLQRMLLSGSLGRKHPGYQVAVASQKETNRMWSEMTENYQHSTARHAMKELERALDSGFVKLEMFGRTPSELFTAAYFGDGATTLGAEMVSPYITRVMEMLDDHDTHPLLDDTTGALVGRIAAKDSFRPRDIAILQGRHVSLAARYLERLPLFESASVSEVLDIRKDLKKPLARFRGALVRFAEGMREVPWDMSFNNEASLIFTREIEPALADIEEHIDSNPYLVRLVANAVSKPLVVPAGSGMAMVVSQFSSMPAILSQAIGIAAGGGLIAYDAFQDWLAQRRSVAQNSLFFYYSVGKRLTAQKRRD